MFRFGPSDRFEPRMPTVDLIPDPPAFFAKLRIQIANTGAAARLKPGERCFGVVTPARMMVIVPAGPPSSMPANLIDQVARLAASERPLNVTAIGFTELKPLQADMLKCLPMLAPLVGLAHLGHSVIVFEGSAGAFQGAIESVDMLIVDSGMLPFLEQDWAAQAWRIMHPEGRILVYQRTSRSLLPIVPSKNEQGWDFGEPDGENSYLNCLLTTLAKLPPVDVEVVAANSLPDLAALATDPEELEWIAHLPFHYEALSAEKVIEFTLQLAKLSRASDAGTEGVLRAKLIVGDQPAPVEFHLQLSKDDAGHEHLKIKRTS